MNVELHDPAPDEALSLALASLGPAADAATRAVEQAIRSGEWGEALAAIELLANESAAVLEPSLYAALLAGAARVAVRAPGMPNAPTGQLASPASIPAWILEGQLASLPPASRREFLRSMWRPEIVDKSTVPETTGLLPLASRAREVLLAKNLVTFDQFKQLSEEAKTRSLAVAGVVREQALAKLQPLLADQALAPSLAGFKRRLQEEGLDDEIAGQHIETAFRTAIATAYNDGMERILEDPIVGDAFPFIEKLPIRDSRLSKVCEWSSRSGIHGTAVYKRDDPAWRLVRPPTHFGCRCGTLPLTAAMALERGIGPQAGHVTLPDALVKMLRR